MTRSRATRRRFLQLAAALGVLPWARAAWARPSGKATAGRPASEVTVVSANIRVPLPEDDAAGRGWPSRREACAEILRRQEADVICLQEVLRDPLDDLLARLPGFVGFGFVGPEMDTRSTGYHGIAKNVILYRNDHYDLASAGGFWLSEQPHLPGSQSWDSARARHVNWVRLRHRRQGGEFRVLTTHLDHQGQRARREQMRMILDETALYPDRFPQILAGDLNVPPHDPVVQAAQERSWVDMHGVSNSAVEDEYSYHAFQGKACAERTPTARRKGRIDFILGRGSLRPLQSALVRDQHKGVYPSDHYFVRARIALVDFPHDKRDDGIHSRAGENGARAGAV